MAEQAFALREHPQIIELMEILEQNGLTKERDEVSSLVEYIGSMEETLAQIRSELQEMHGEVKEIQDKGFQAQCSRLVDTTKEKVMQTGEMVSTVKTNFVQAAGNAVKTFKEKGRAVLAQAVRAMKIPTVLSKMKNSLHTVGKSMQEAAGKVDAKREQLHEAGAHLQNAGRALSGKPAEEVSALDSDKGILAKLRKSLEGLGRTFEAMGDRAGNLEKALQKEEPEQKPSVKTSLRVLKSQQAAKTSAPVQTEQVR